MLLLNGDCLEKMKDISSNTVDLIICDLPFGCLTGGGGEEKKRRRFMNGKDTGTEIKQKEGVIAGCSWDIALDLEAFWKEVKRIRKNEHTPCLHFCTTKYGFDLYNSNPKEFRYDLVWDKGRGVSFLSANKMPMRSHEMMYVFSKAGAYYNRVDISGDFPSWVGSHSYSKVYNLTKPEIEGYKKGEGEGKRCALSVLSHIKTTRKGGHPTEKPTELYKFLIERYCPVGGTVLDPTFGSCNSGIACQELGRHYIGIEKDKGFYDKALKKFSVV
jgi:site-specific DNA-methyltransferase (adenine-specific)